MSKEELRAQAAISILSGIIETTNHSVIECLAVKDLYADIAVLYADALIAALDKPKIDSKSILKRIKDKV